MPAMRIIRQARALLDLESIKTIDVFESQRRHVDRQKSGGTESSYPRFPSILGALIIAAAILLSTLIQTALTRYVAVETANEETAWLLDRLTGNLYKCQAASPGRASCESDVATGSIVKPKKPAVQ